MNWVFARGAGAVRTGLEDNIRISKDRLAKSNTELGASCRGRLRQTRRAARDTARGSGDAKPVNLHETFC